jgi:hypothetical protein
MPEKKNTIKPQKLTVTKVRMKKQDFLEAKIFILW